MSLWAFRFLLWYICILMVQPQNRFPFLWPLHIADISVIMALGLHVASAITEKRPVIRFGPATITGLILFVAAYISLYIGAYQMNSNWNDYSDMLAKNMLVMLLVEVMATNIQRVWAVLATMVLSSLWWIKGGLRLSAAGMTYSGDRLMGPAVSLIENPNGFAYMMCVMIPLFLYFYQQSKQRVIRWLFMFLALAAVFIVFRTGSRTGMLILIAMGFFLLPKYGGQYKMALIVGGFVIFMFLPLIGGLNVQRFKTIPRALLSVVGVDVEMGVDDEQSMQSADERKYKNRDTWKLIKEHPLFGAGVNANERLYARRFPMATGQVHCEILMAGRQMGVVGMSIYMVLLGILLVHGMRIQKYASKWWPEMADLGWTFKMQMLVFVVGGSFSPLPWNAPELILVGAASALWSNVKEQEFAFGTLDAEGVAPAQVEGTV
jgi:hypothetical protein